MSASPTGMNTLLVKIHTVFLPELSEGPLVRNSRSRPPKKNWESLDDRRHGYVQREGKTSTNNPEVKSHRIQLQTARVEVVANMFFQSRHPVMGGSAYLGTAKNGQARGKR